MNIHVLKDKRNLIQNVLHQQLFRPVNMTIQYTGCANKSMDQSIYWHNLYYVDRSIGFKLDIQTNFKLNSGFKVK